MRDRRKKWWDPRTAPAEPTRSPLGLSNVIDETWWVGAGYSIRPTAPLPAWMRNRSLLPKKPPTSQ